MNAKLVAGSLLSGILLVASPVAGQQVSANIFVRSGPVAGHVGVGNEHSTYRRPPVVVYERRPARRVVVVERYAPRVVVIERLHRRHLAQQWRRFGYRPVTVYYLDGRYYDHPIRSPRLREVVVYERAGRFYTDCGEHDRHDYGHDHYDRGYDDHDGHRHGNWDD